MKKLITTALAALIALYGYSQDGIHLPLSGGTTTGHVTMGGGTNGNTNYGNSTLELREANFGYNIATPPRLSFHWGNVVASQIGIESNGRIAILNNPGTAYEDLIAKNVYGTSATFSQYSNFAKGLWIGNEGSANAISGQGSYIHWNDLGNGITHIINQRGGGTGGFKFQESTSDNVRTDLLTLEGNGAATFSGNITGTSANFTNNVSIGTSQTNSNLYVYGLIKSKEVKVEATITVPDYVFEKSYDLKPLAEVEKYIKENKHLPEIPSAKLIDKEGINVGNMQLRLLKKIEELTLYMIEQNKESAELRKTVQLQNQRISNLEKQLKK